MKLIMCIIALGVCEISGAQIKTGKNFSSRQIVEYLAADSLGGRFPGTRGDSLAREFIAARMQELGLRPCFEGPDGKPSYFQPFELILSRRVEGENFLRIGAEAFSGAEPGGRREPVNGTDKTGRHVGRRTDMKNAAVEADVNNRAANRKGGACGKEMANVEAGTEFYPAPFSGSGSYYGPVVEAGYGLQVKAGPFKMDDYRDKDVKGKCVLIAGGLPPRLAALVQENTEPSRGWPAVNSRAAVQDSARMPSRMPFPVSSQLSGPDTAQMSSQMSFRIPPQMSREIKALGNSRAKALLAQDKGAAAVILVDPEGTESAARAAAAEGGAGVPEKAENRLVWEKSKEFPLNIPVVRITRSAAERFFPGWFTGHKDTGNINNNEISEETGYKTGDRGGNMRKDRDGNGPAFRANLCATIRQVAVTTCNIAGSIPGEKNEFIIVGAHYDHLGDGGPGSGSRWPDTLAVHNGADDNASGIAGMLYLAEMFSKEKPEKGLIFAAFGAEEEGVAGSGYFAEHLPVEKQRIGAMFNFDMIGNLRGSALTVGGTGTALQTDSLLKEASRKMPGLKIKSSPQGHGPSDHAPFYAKHLPVFYFTSGGTMEYHTPDDDAFRLNYSGLDSVAGFAGVLLREVMRAPQGLTFREAGSPEASPMRGGFKVTLGLMPDVTGASNDGLRAEVVIKGKAADRAGLKSGDVITGINGLTVGNIEDYMARLGTLKAGETARVKVRREGKILEFEVQL